MHITGKIFIITALGFVPIISLHGIASQNDIFLNHSIITPYMEVPIQRGQNIVFCAAFQVAWNQLTHRIIKKDIRLEKPADLLPYLNRGLSTEMDLPAE